MTGLQMHMGMPMHGYTEDKNLHKLAEATEETELCRGFSKLVKEQHLSNEMVLDTLSLEDLVL